MVFQESVCKLRDLEVMLHGKLFVVVGLQLLCQVLIISVLLGADEETCWRVLVKGKEVVEDVFGLLLIPPILLKVLLISEGLSER